MFLRNWQAAADWFWAHPELKPGPIITDICLAQNDQGETSAKTPFCHPERSEGSPFLGIYEILRS
ncbi:MAG TPA: hypothetical protein VE082_03350, partial [Desulfobaccales bacterium]|nr:hypothetical protein [Desulfobaccales bacterium]